MSDLYDSFYHGNTDRCILLRGQYYEDTTNTRFYNVNISFDSDRIKTYYLSFTNNGSVEKSTNQVYFSTKSSDNNQWIVIRLT